MSSTLQRRCAHDGCHAVAVPPDAHCPSHRASAAVAPDRARTPKPPRQRDEFSISVKLRHDLGQISAETLDAVALEIGSVRSMTREIGILRILLDRVIQDGAEAGDPKALVRDVLPLVAEIGRALRVNEHIKDGERDVIAEAMKRTLIEHGKSLKL